MKNWTVLPLIETASKFLKEKSSDSPRLEAELLLAEALGTRRINLYLHYNRPVTEAEITKFRELIKKRADGCPVSYLLGKKEFFSLTFSVNTYVMIPRPETEHLVTEVIDTCTKNDLSGILLADIGTGSGCIAIAIAKNLPQAEIVATDISLEALQCAKQNIALHNLDNRIKLVEGDFLNALQEVVAPGKVDFIISNPPYISEEEFEKLPISIKNYEPKTAFLAGKDGLDGYRKIISQSPKFLKPNGHLILELGWGTSEKVKSIVEENGSFKEVVIKKDFSGINRVLHTRKR